MNQRSARVLLLCAIASCAPATAGVREPVPAGVRAPVPAATVPERRDAGAAQLARPAESYDGTLGLETFDSAWSKVSVFHYDTTFGGLDWSAVREELRPRAAAARSETELRALITDMVSRLGVSHYTLIPREATGALEPERAAAAASKNGAGEAADDAQDIGVQSSPGSPDGVPADAGLELRLVESRLVSWRLQPRGAAFAAGVKPGWEVVKLAGVDVGAALERLAALDDLRKRQVAISRFLHGVNGILRGELGDTVQIAFLVRDGESRDAAGVADTAVSGGAASDTAKAMAGAKRAGIMADARDRPVDRGGDPDTMAMALPLRVSDAQLIRFGNLPPMFAQIRRERREVADGCVGIIALSVWMAPLAAEVDRAVDALRDCRGIVLDLRGNPGGVAGMVMGVGGHFVDSTRALGTLRMRTNELRFVVNPRPVNGRGEQVGVYGGPVAILVDVMSASTSEIFAAGLQAIGRARVFGEVSAGQALPARATSLPNGDVLMHAIADYLVVDGSRVEGRGVLPDEVVPLRITDVMAGRDAPLDAALRWIAAEAE